MYDFRRWTPQQRRQVVAARTGRGYPQHGPPHIELPRGYRIVTGTCFEHAAILSTPDRLLWFERELLMHLDDSGIPCTAWVVLPNHYHILVEVENIRSFMRSQGELHGRTSFEFNRQDARRGRQVWYRSQDRCMRNERHYFTTVNYIHNNPIKHGYVSKWQDWPYSSFHWYLATMGREWLVDVWREYPVLNYGDSWDV